MITTVFTMIGGGWCGESGCYAGTLFYGMGLIICLTKTVLTAVVN